MDDRTGEFPRVADNVIGLKHRYGYIMRGSEGGLVSDPATTSGGIRKYDREAGTFSDIDFGIGRQGGEPVFAPSADPKSEDDGYLMTYVYDADTDSSQLVIMDAASMDDTPVAAVELPRIPGGFHGSWIPASVAD